MKKNINDLTTEQITELKKIIDSQEGAIGYILAWFMGVPAVLLFVIFVLRGFN